MAATHQIRFRPFAVSDLRVVGPWLKGAGLGPPPGASHKQWGERVESDPRIRCATAEIGPRPVGAYRLDLAPDRSAEVTVVVAPSHRRRGLGRSILAAATAEARRRGLTDLVAMVRSDNRAGRAFFADAGYEDVGERVPGYSFFECPVGHATPVMLPHAP